MSLLTLFKLRIVENYQPFFALGFQSSQRYKIGVIPAASEKAFLRSKSRRPASLTI